MEPSFSNYSNQSDDSLYSTFTSSSSSGPGQDLSSNGIDIPRSHRPLDPFDDFSLSISPTSTLQSIPELSPFGAVPYGGIPFQPSSSPFDTTFQFPVPWPGDEFNFNSYPESTSSSSSPPEQTKYVSPSLPLFQTLPKLTRYRQTRSFCCMCCGKAFTRSADLKRHESSVHFPVRQDCPVHDCLRKHGNGFPRRDHLIEHLRSYHHWNVPKKRVSKRGSKSS